MWSKPVSSTPRGLCISSSLQIPALLLMMNCNKELSEEKKTLPPRVTYSNRNPNKTPAIL